MLGIQPLAAMLAKIGLATEPPPFEAPAEEEPAPPLSDFVRGRLAIELFASNIDISRVGVSYAVAISFRSRNPQLAAEALRRKLKG